MYHMPVSDAVKAKAVQDLINGIMYIKDNPIDYRATLLRLSNKIFNLN
jgi:hypothetical protein